MKIIIALVIGSICWSASDVVAASSSLDGQQTATLQAWLAKNSTYRLATVEDCDCDADIRRMRTIGSYEGPVPDYKPYTLIGDFRGNGQSDFATVVTDIAKHTDGTLLIFDGPFLENAQKPAFVSKVGKLRYLAMFKSPKGPWPVVGKFESEGCVYRPSESSYIADCHY